MTEIKDENKKRRPGPFHKFFCLQRGRARNYRTYFGETPDVKINDDFIRHINYSLLWVPSVYVSNSKTQNNCGLMLYGTTIIKREGAKTFGNIMRSWAELFSQGPDRFTIRGGIMIKSDGTVPRPHKFHMIEIERDEIVQSLRTLAKFADKTDTDDFFILHFGV